MPPLLCLGPGIVTHRGRLSQGCAAALLLFLALLSVGARTDRRAGAAKGPIVVPEEEALTRSMQALAEGRIEEARGLLGPLTAERVPRGKEDDFAYLNAMLLEDGDAHVSGLEEYLRALPKGHHRREATLALARAHYARGEYPEAERLLSLFSPGVERDFVGRQALVQMGLAQLARGDAPGALQFLHSAEPDLRGSPQEEAYYFAVAEAALRASRPAEATEALRRLLAQHPKGDYAPQALYALGISLESVGRAGDAAGVFRQVMVRYPSSYEAARVRDRGIRVGGAGGAPLPLLGGYAIQVGAFSRRDLAESLERDLKLAGVEDVSVKQGSESPPIFRVRAGAFRTKDEARALGERLRRERGFSFTIVSR
jgi:tetratricopeptide (TPR) repeat protein